MKIRFVTKLRLLFEVFFFSFLKVSNVNLVDFFTGETINDATYAKKENDSNTTGNYQNTTM